MFPSSHSDYPFWQEQRIEVRHRQLCWRNSVNSGSPVYSLHWMQNVLFKERHSVSKHVSLAVLHSFLMTRTRVRPASSWGESSAMLVCRRVLTKENTSVSMLVVSLGSNTAYQHLPHSFCWLLPRIIRNDIPGFINLVHMPCICQWYQRGFLIKNMVFAFYDKRHRHRGNSSA